MALVGQRRVLKKPLNLAVAFASQLQHVVEIQESGAVQLGGFKSSCTCLETDG